MYDPASQWGMPENDEDFGQTLGHYGVGTGPYLVLPIVGPSTLRDTSGLVVDMAARTFMWNWAWDEFFGTASGSTKNQDRCRCNRSH